MNCFCFNCFDLRQTGSFSEKRNGILRKNRGKGFEKSYMDVGGWVKNCQNHPYVINEWLLNTWSHSSFWYFMLFCSSAQSFISSGWISMQSFVLFCFEWIGGGRTIDWYRLDLILIFEDEGFLYETFLGF